PYPHPFQQALAALVNLSDDYQVHGVAGTDPDPLVTPPLYGRWHALASRLLTNRDGTPVTPNDNWVHELNLDPRFRVPAGTGGRVVREHEEEFRQAGCRSALGRAPAATSPSGRPRPGRRRPGRTCWSGSTPGRSPPHRRRPRRPAWSPSMRWNRCCPARSSRRRGWRRIRYPARSPRCPPVRTSWSRCPARVYT